MTSLDLRHLHAPRDPSDPWDKIPFPGDNRSYPDKPPEQLDSWELDLLVAEHCHLTNGACECGWCVYVEDPTYYATHYGDGVRST